VLLAGGSYATLDYSIKVNPASMPTNSEPSVDIAPNGDFLVAWHSGSDIHSRAYGSSMSAKQTTPLNLTAALDRYPWCPDVATNEFGKSVVVWEHPIDYATYHDAVLFQQLGTNGAPASPSPGVVYDDQAYFRDSKVAMADSGDFAVAWTEVDADPDFYPASDVYCGFFHEDGTPYDAPSDVASSSLYEYVDGVAIDSADRTSVVVWRQSPVESTDNYEIYFRMHDFSGGEVEDFVEPTRVGSGVDAAVATDEQGNFVIAWIHDGDIVAQRFTDQGTRIGSSVVLVKGEPALFGSQTNLDLSICASHGVVGYEQRTGDYSYGSFVRHFQFTGNSITPGVQRSLGATNNGLDSGPSVAMNTSGQFVVSYIRDSDQSVRVRKFRSDGTPVWPQSYVFYPAPALPISSRGTADTTPISGWSFDVIDSTSGLLPINSLPTDGRAEAPTLAVTCADRESRSADAVNVKKANDTRSSPRNDVNDKALLAIMDEWNGLPVVNWDGLV